MTENLLPMTIDFQNKEVVATLKQTVAKGLTDAEFMLFSEYCKSTGLNPFKREIWAIKAGNQLQLMTGINGFYQTANRHPQFDGIEVEIVEEGGKIVKAVAKAYRKDRRIPMTAEAYWVEYNKGHGNWKTMPRVMLSKCAESMALRKAFPQELNGLYSQEEMPAQFAVENVRTEVPKPKPVPKKIAEPVVLDDGDDVPDDFFDDINADTGEVKPAYVSMKYFYPVALNKDLDTEKKLKAVEYAQGMGATIVKGNVFSNKKLPRLKNYEVDNLKGEGTWASKEAV